MRQHSVPDPLLLALRTRPSRKDWLPTVRLSVAALTLRSPLTHVSQTAREPIMRSNEYYSINQSDPDVHHNDSGCPVGRQIPAYNKRAGTNGWPLCKRCE